LYEKEKADGRGDDRVPAHENAIHIPDPGRSTQDQSLKPRKAKSAAKNVRYYYYYYFFKFIVHIEP
jgi:hypothetical protein